MTIGRKRPEPPKESDKNPGAGNYDPDRANGLIKPKCPGVDMGKSPSRPSTFAKPGSDPYGGPDPGSYDAVRKFGNDVKPMTIGVKRPKKFTTDAPGPDAYQPQRGDTLTKPKTPGVDMGKSPSRPATFAKPGTDADGGPGTYDAGKKFMDDVKPFTIGKKRPKKIDTSVPEPGRYNPDRADTVIKPKNPAAIIPKSPSRPKSIPRDSEAGGPGSYDIPFYKFGDETKPMTIGVKRPKPAETDVPEPGRYSPERADKLTKPKEPATVDMGRAPAARPKPNPDSENTAGPGAYDSPVKFGEGVKPMTIGEKRPERNPLMDNPGAGNYSPERGDILTKPKIPNIDMGKSPSRPSTFAKPGTDEAGGPGTYDVPYYKFGDDSKPMTIGVKRPEKIETGVPDAGQYSPERGDHLTKPKVPDCLVDMSRAPPARPERPPPSET